MEESFLDNVFDYIRNQYGKSVLKVVQADKNKTVISKLVEVSIRDHNSVEYAANKIVAMVRANP